MSELNMTTFQHEISLGTSFSRRRKTKPKLPKTNGQPTHSKILPSVCGDDSSNEFIDVISTPNSPLEVFLNISDLIPNFEGIEIGTNSSVHKQSILNTNSNSAFRITDSADSCESNKESCHNDITEFSTVFSPNRTDKQDVKVPVRPNDIINLDLVLEKTLSVCCERLDLEQFCSRNRYKKISSDTVLLKSIPIVEKSMAVKDDLESAALKCHLKASSKKLSIKCEDNLSSNYTPPTIIRCSPVTSNSTCTTPIVIWPASSRTNLKNDDFSNINNQTINISNNCSFPAQFNHSVNVSNDHRNIEYNPISSLNHLYNPNSVPTAAVASSVNNELDALNSLDDAAILDALNLSSVDLTSIENDENIIELFKELNNLMNSSSDSQNTNLFSEKNISSGENLCSTLDSVTSPHLNNNVPSLDISQANSTPESSNLHCVNVPTTTTSHSTLITNDSKIAAIGKFSRNVVIPATSTPVKVTSDVTVMSTSDTKSQPKCNEVVEIKDEEEVLDMSEEKRLEDIKKEMESFMLSAKPKILSNITLKPHKRKTIASKTSKRWRLLNQKKPLPSYPPESSVNSEFSGSQYSAALDGLLFSGHSDLFVDNFVTDYVVADAPKNKIKSPIADNSSDSSDNSLAGQNNSPIIADESSAASNKSRTTNNSSFTKDKPLKNHAKQNKSKTNEFVCSLVNDEKRNNKKSFLKGSYRSPIRIKVSRNFTLNLKKSTGEFKKHRRKKYVSLRKPHKQSGGRNKQTFSPDDTILSSKKKSSKQSVNVKHKHLKKDKKSNSSTGLIDFNCTENESHEKENVTGNSFASRSSANDEVETSDNEAQHRSNNSESSGSDEKLEAKLIRTDGKIAVSSHLISLSPTTNIAQIQDNNMESIKKNGSLECENDVSMDSDSANISTKTACETTIDETSEPHDNSVSSEKANSTSSSNDLCESELQSNEITSETLTVSRDTGDNEREAEAKLENCGLSEVSVSRVKRKGEEKLACEVESTSEQSEADDRVSSSELTKGLTNEDSANAILESNMEDKSDLLLSESIPSEDMEVDLKVGDEECEIFKPTVEPQELGDNILSDNAVDNTFEKAEVSHEASIHNKSSLLDKDMDSTNDSHILERDLKLSDDSSDNLIIIDEESGSKEISKEDIDSKLSENNTLKSFENLVGDLTQGESKEIEDKMTTTSDSVNQETTSTKARTKGKLKKLNNTDKSSVVSEIHAGKGKTSKKDNTRATINIKKDSVINDSEELSSQNVEKSISDSSSLSNISLKRRASSDEVQFETDEVLISPNTSETKPIPVQDEIPKSITPIKAESNVIVSKKSNKKQAKKKSNEVKAKESKEGTLSETLDITSEGSKPVNAAEPIEDVSLKSLLVNTPKSSNEESSFPELSLTDGPSSQEDGKLSVRRPPRNKVKKRPYSPDTTPSISLVNKTPSNKTLSSGKLSTPTSSKVSTPTSNKVASPASLTSSPSSAQRKKLKKYNAEDVVVPFKCGWMRELVHRATTTGKAKASDVYYFTPEGNKLRSMPEITKYLTEHEGHGLTSDNFTFAKETIYRSPFERERDANVKSIIVNKSSSEVPSSGKKKPAKKSLDQSSITDSSPASTKIESTTTSEKSVEKKPVEKKTPKTDVASTEKSSKSSEKRSTKSEQSLEKRKAEPESNPAGTRKTRVRSTDSITADTPKENADKTEHKSKSAKLSNDSGSKPKKSEKTPIIKVKFTKSFGKSKTTPTANIRGIGCDIEDDLQQILTTSVEKSTSKDANKKPVRTKSAPPSKPSQKNAVRNPCTSRCQFAAIQHPTIECEVCHCLFHPSCISRIPKTGPYICGPCKLLPVENQVKEVSGLPIECTPNSEQQVAENSIPVSVLTPDVSLTDSHAHKKNVATSGSSDNYLLDLPPLPPLKKVPDKKMLFVGGTEHNPSFPVTTSQINASILQSRLQETMPGIRPLANFVQGNASSVVPNQMPSLRLYTNVSGQIPVYIKPNSMKSGGPYSFLLPPRSMITVPEAFAARQRMPVDPRFPVMNMVVNQQNPVIVPFVVRPPFGNCPLPQTVPTSHTSVERCKSGGSKPHEVVIDRKQTQTNGISSNAKMNADPSSDNEPSKASLKDSPLPHQEKTSNKSSSLEQKSNNIVERKVKTYGKKQIKSAQSNVSILAANPLWSDHIFKELNVANLLRVAQVCKIWNKQAHQTCFWKKISFKGLNILNWSKCTETLKKNGTKILDMRGLHDLCMENTWQSFIKCVENLENIEQLVFDQIPPKVLETVADSLPLLRSLECCCLTATFKRPDLWETPCQLNFSNIRYLRKLRKLKIRSAGGLISQDASSVLQNLPELRHLSLTTIKVSASDHLNFLSKLPKLVFLEFGDCNTWTKENYEALGDLKDLRHLRLENGGDFHDTSLPEALKKLKNLEDLELMNFKIPKTLGDALGNLNLLTKLSLWPDMSKQVPEVNYNTFQCVIQAKSVKYFCWGIISIDDSIPMLQFSKDPMPSNQDDSKSDIEELDYEELFERLCKVLPDDAKAEIKCISHSFLNEYCCIKR